MNHALVQGCLFDAAEVPPTLPLPALVDRARAYVAAVLRRRVCADCCSDEELQCLHRRPLRAPWDKPVARLVQAGAALARLAEEIAKCDVVCVRCQARRLSRRRWRDHNLSVLHRGASIGVVAKARSTTGSGESAPRPRMAKVREIRRKTAQVA